MSLHFASPETIAAIAVLLAGFGVYKLCKWMVKSLDDELEDNFRRKGL